MLLQCLVICPGSHFKQREDRAGSESLFSAHSSAKVTETLWLIGGLLKASQCRFQYFSRWHSHTEPTLSSSVSRPSCFLLIVTSPGQFTPTLSGYPVSVCSDCTWMVPVARCGEMVASLRDKQPHRKGGRKITNQCVQLPNDTKRSGVEAVSHFSPKAFMEELAFLRGWVDGCLLMDWLWLTTRYYWQEIEHTKKVGLLAFLCVFCPLFSCCYNSTSFSLLVSASVMSFP